MNLDIINQLYLELSQFAKAKTKREMELEELLRSACCIAERQGKGTHWGRFINSVNQLGLNGITARTYRLLPDDEGYDQSSDVRKYCMDPDHCTHSDCPAAFCDRHKPMPPNKRVYAPFTEEQMKCLDAWQTSGEVHPFTCCDHQTMVVKPGGFVCPKCGQVQNWCHDFMATYQPRKNPNANP